MRMNEEWLPIFDMEDYEVSNLGAIRNARTDRILKTFYDRYGNEQVRLYVERQRHTYQVSRLVALAFCDGYEKGLEVWHMDGNRRNNRADNLKWKTRSFIIKQRYSIGRKYLHRTRPIRCIETGEEWNSIIEASRVTGLNRDSISKCVNNPYCKTHNGYHFEAIE